MSEQRQPNVFRVTVLAVAVLITANAGIFWYLSSRLARIEQQLIAASAGSSPERGNTDQNPQRQPALTLESISGSGAPSGEALRELIRQQVKPRIMADPVDVAAKLDNIMASEPPMPEVEKSNRLWLNTALQKMPAEAPKGANLETSCRGRHCMVSGIFASDNDARNWAMRYLLAAGGQHLEYSTTVVVPLGGQDQESVGLQLHLY